MMNSRRPLIQVKQPRFRAWSQSFLVGALAAVGVSSGLIPDLAERSPALMFSTSAVAQSASVTDAEVKSYAEAVLAMEGGRVTAYSEIKKILNSGDIPEIVCTDSGSINKLPNNVRGIAVNFCNSSKAIVANSGLRSATKDSVKRFNEITILVQKDSSLKKRVENELLRLQKSAGNR